MSEKSPGEQQIGLIKREEQPSVTLDPARACFHAAKSLRFSGWVCTIAMAGDRNRKFLVEAVHSVMSASESALRADRG